MLLNEAKYLGPKFMALRWVLTVLAILVFSWIAARIVKDEDLPQEEEKRDKVTINNESCRGCSGCAEDYPELFEMKQATARVKDLEPSLIDKDKLKKAMDDCPVKAIEGPDA